MSFTIAWLTGHIASAQTAVIPTVSATGTYDSNVFWTPKSLLEPGTKPEDFIATVTPQILVAHTSSLIRGSLSVGALISRYINNPNLDYTGANAAGQLDIKNWANKLSQRISALTIRGTYQYSPSTGGYGGVAGGVGQGFGTTGVTSPVNVGLITNRVSTQNINLGIAGGYILTRTTTLNGTYTYTKLHYGNQSGGVQNQLFDTDGHQASLNLATRMTAVDTVGTTASLSHYEQSQSSGSGSGSFTTISGMANWTRTWTQRLTTTLGGGGIATLPIDTGVEGQSIKTQVAPTASMMVTYSTFSDTMRTIGATPSPFEGLPTLAGSLNPGGISAPGQLVTALSYNFSVFPSYGFSSGPMKTHVVGVNLSGGVTPKLTATAGANYSHGAASFPTTTFDTVGLTAGARYLLGPILANLTYTWLYTANNTTQTPGTQNETAFSKKMVMLSLAYAFTPEQFFRMGAFSNWGSPSFGGSGAGPSGTGAEGGSSGQGPGILKKE